MMTFACLMARLPTVRIAACAATFAAACVLGACATTPPTVTHLHAPEEAKAARGTIEPASPPAPPSRSEKIVRTVRRWVGLRSLRKISRKVPDDCTGLVRLGYARAGLVAEGSSDTLWRTAQRAGATKRRDAEPGDLVFFRETYDRNRDGRRNDGITHVGIVESVDEDGTVTFIHRGGTGVVRARLNLRHPSRRVDEGGKVLNDYLRRPDGTRAPRLTGQLFVGFAAPDAYDPAALRASAAPSSPR